MKYQRFTLEAVIVTAAAIMVTYMLSIMLGLRLELILGLYVASTTTTLWMVFRILKDPYTTDKTFDEFFYQDRPDLRRNGSE